MTSLPKLVFITGTFSLLGLLACTPSEQGDEHAIVIEESTQTAAAATVNNFSPRPTAPRIPPLGKDSPELDDAQRAMLAAREDFNLYKALVHHVDLYNRWTPLGRQLLNGSTLPPRDREIIMLRMGWLAQAEYEWAQHARIATADNIGMTAEEIRNIAIGVSAPEWTDWERTLITMVDELRYDAIISDETWEKLSARYSTQEIIDGLFTAAQYQLVSMLLNSGGVQLDPILEFRLPTDLPLPALASQTRAARLDTPRLAPLAAADWNEKQAQVIKPQIREDGSVLNLYATLIHHPDLYTPRYTFGSFLQRDSSLPPITRELLIMRTGYLLNCEYEWGHHAAIAKQAGLSDEAILRIAQGPTAPGWSEEYAAVLQAADELRREAFINDDTWETLKKYYNTQQLLELVFTVGGYSMTALAINSLGIQLEEGYPSLPELAQE